MPDLTLESVQVCAQSEPYKHHWHEGGYTQALDRNYELECTCKGYQFGHRCKHIKAVDALRCNWHGMYGAGQTEEQAEARICPECGGPTIHVMVGV